jgi:hypothetical protein
MLTLVVIGIALAAIGEPSGYQVIRSKPSGILVVECWLYKPRTNFYTTDSIEYDWVTTTMTNCKVVLPKEEYRCFVQIFDSASNAVPLRKNFEYVGKHFCDLKYPCPEQEWSQIEDVLSMKPAHVTGPPMWLGEQMMADFVMASDIGEHRTLHNIDEMFDVKKAGPYTVRLHFHAFALIHKGGQQYAYKLERFEPIEFMVTKAPPSGR